MKSFRNTNLRRPLACFVLFFSYCSLARANVVGASAQNFSSTTNGIDFVTVQSSETLQPGIVNLGLFFNYAVNSLPYIDDSVQGRLSFNDTLLASDLNMGVGLRNNWEVGLSLPAILAQTVADASPLHGFFSKKGLSEVRLMSKYHVWGNDTWGTAIVASVNFNQVVNDPFTGTGAGPTWNIELVVDRTFFEKLNVALNMGTRLRNPGTAISTFLSPPANQFLLSAGASYLLPWVNTKLISEIYTSWPMGTQDTQTSRYNSSAEWIAGLKKDLTNALAVHAGLGTELSSGQSSPDWRVYTGLNYTFGPVFKPFTGLRKQTNDSFIGNIVFEFDSDVMTGAYEQTLAKLDEAIREGGGFKKLSIEGHTDSIGGAEYNQRLSQKRADAIKKYLVSKYKYDQDNIVSSGSGELRPIADNGNFQGRQANRRVEFKVER